MRPVLSFCAAIVLLIAFAAPPAAAMQPTIGEPVPSAGCDAPPPRVTGQSVTETLVTAEGMREYRLYVPSTYDPAQPTTLVLSFHGFASSPPQQEAYSAWNPISEEHGFVVVYPQGSGVPARWNTGPLFEAGFASTDDVAFVRDLIAHLTETLCIDTTHIHASGFSNGAGMANRLACEAADLIAAIGGVGGAYPAIECTPARPVPVITFHGTDDPIVPIDGGDVGIGGGMLPAIADWTADWAARNDCDLDPANLPAIGAVTGIRYNECAGAVEVIYYTIAGGGHTWPGGNGQLNFLLGPTNRDIVASELIWEFFQRHPLVADQG